MNNNLTSMLTSRRLKEKETEIQAIKKGYEQEINELKEYQSI